MVKNKSVEDTFGFKTTVFYQFYKQNTNNLDQG